MDCEDRGYPDATEKIRILISHLRVRFGGRTPTEEEALAFVYGDKEARCRVWSVRS